MRRTVVALGAGAAVAALIGIPADGMAQGGLEADLGDSAAKRGQLVLDLEGTSGNDRIDVTGLPGKAIVVSVPAPATITGPAQCDQNTPQQFTCEGSLGIDGVRGFMLAGADKFIARNSLAYVTNSYGGAGNDVLKGGRKFDFINGQGGGSDRCRGRKGAETLKNCE